MNRREALKYFAPIFGAAMIAPALLEACKKADTKKDFSNFTEEEINFLGEVSEVIIPTTDTPGAKVAGVGAFMNVMVVDCYTKEEQNIFYEGLNKIDQLAKKDFGSKFLDLDKDQKKTLLSKIDDEQKALLKENKDNKHYFKMMKDLTILGYFTSEIGATKAMRYEETPGRYEPCIDYKKGDKGWLRI